MRILITGGAGCLGSNLIERFIPAGHEVMAIDNFATGKREVLPPIDGLTVVEGTIADESLVDDCFGKFQPTHVIHSAASYKDPTDWCEDAATNVKGAVAVAKAAIKHRVKRLINFQTALVYGRPVSVPIPVGHRIAPFTSYGISKACGEQYLLLIAKEVPVVSLRLANVTGPRLAIGPIPTFYKRLNAGQKCFCTDVVRDFLDMTDFIAIVERVLESEAPGGVFNVSTGEGHTIKDVFDIVVEHTGADAEQHVPVVPPGEDDVAALVLDPAETIEQLAWSPQIGFVETIRRVLAWYDEHGVSDVYSHLAVPAATDPSSRR